MEAVDLSPVNREVEDLPIVLTNYLDTRNAPAHEILASRAFLLEPFYEGGDEAFIEHRFHSGGLIVGVAYSARVVGRCWVSINRLGRWG